MLADFWTLRGTTAPGFSDAGRISIEDILTMYKIRFWKEIGYPFADYFDTIVMLDKTFRDWHARNNPPEK